MSKELIVDGFLFDSLEDANEARLEKEKIIKLNDKLKNCDNELLYKVYNKSLEKKTFKTPIGYAFLDDIRNKLLNSGYDSNYEGGKSTDFSTFCPLKLTLTSDGDILYVDSDKGGWTADSYNRVKKSKYNSFCKDNMLIDDALSLKCNEIYDEK